MCGFAAIFDHTGAPAPAAVLSAMAQALHHRGPDDRGVFTDGPVGLASTRLSIHDLSPAGHMPMVDDETGNVIAFNGEVYNFKEIRDQLGRERFRTGTDTEVVLKAYATHGERCLELFNGIFAFALYDRKARRLFCARDRMGVKPFFHARMGGRILLASEVKGILAAGVAATPDRTTIGEYLTLGLYDHSRRSFFDGISQLPPGSAMTIDAAGIREWRYWDLRPADEAASTQAGPGALEAAQDELVALLQDSIRLQMRSDVPIALHVSGGLDSTLLLGLVHAAAGGQGGIRAYHYCYGEPRYDETPHVEEVGRRMGWRIEPVVLRPAEVPALAAEAMWQQEQPYPGVVGLARHNLIRRAYAPECKVILEGQGGDEVFAGYRYYLGPHVMDLLREGDVDEAEATIAAFARRNGMTEAAAQRVMMNGLAAYFRADRSADGSSFVKLDCIHPSLRQTPAPEWEQPFRSQLLNMQYRDLFHTKLPRILRSCDRASMGYGKELRVPFLDHRLVEFSFRLPGRLKIVDGQQRALLRDAARRFLPDALIDAPKRPVVDPQRDWLAGPLAEWAGDILASRGLAERGILDQPAVLAEFDRYRADDGRANSFHIWQWISLEMWFQTFVDNRGEAS
jgi:asparagine synthase (glutamine-hydrolysing)